MNDGKVIGLLILLGILIIFSAFFSASETAFTSLNIARLKKYSERKKSARIVLKMSENYDRILSTILIGNNIVNIAAASLATLIFTYKYDDIGVTISTIVMTVIVLIFGEVSPKSIAKERPERFAMMSAYILYGFSLLFMPLNYLFNGWKKLLIKILRLGKKRPTLTEEEFKIIVTDIKNEGILNDIEHDLIHNTILYGDALVQAVMTNIEKIIAIDINQSIDSIKQLFKETNYSRVPVYLDNIHNLIGILYRTDFYEILLNNDCNIKAILRPPLYALANDKVSQLFKRLQREKQHIAIVISENLTIGLITMEDILEELVGEIDDKFDLKNNY